MPTVIAVHSVADMKSWLAGSENRSGLFKEFCTGYRLYRQPDQNRVALVFENCDVARMEATLGSPAVAAAKKQDTVLDPIELFVEIPDAR